MAVAELYTGGRSLADTLQTVADGVVSGFGYELACVNIVQADGDLVVAAFAGSPEAEALITGRTGSRASWERRLTMGEDWDGLRFIPHTEGHVLLEDDVPQWYTQGPEPKREDDWHPLDRLYAPLYGPTSDLLGVISVDRPVGGIRPGQSDRGALRTYAFHCAIAIGNARLRANMQRALVRLERQQQALRASEESFRQAFEYAPSGMAIAEVGGDQHGRLLRTNDALCLMLGRPASAMRRLSFSDLVHPEDIGTLLRTSAEGGRAELRLARRDGSYVWVSLRNSIVADTTNGPRFLLTNIDSIEDRKHRDLALEVRARYDALTGLLSETELHDRLHGRLCNRADEDADGPDFALLAALTSTSAGYKGPALRGSSAGLLYDHRHTEEPGKGEATLAVLHCGIDKFKKINTRFGLAAGNAVLIEISRRLRQEMPADCDIARLRGDEFVVLVDNVDEKGAEKVAAGVRDVFRRSIALGPSNERARIEATSVLSWASCGIPADQILGRTSQLLHSKKQLG
ncbi:diguanylate cyclase domain-containing protein [Streptomyces scopuliridis]|uniref:diguanylate cyclase domain-containing protein n=1 Tax=Streptomyces scopuliridis TaxID=452529 RepID=UPI0036ADB060